MWMQVTKMDSKFRELSFFQIDLWTWCEEIDREVHNQSS